MDYKKLSADLSSGCEENCADCEYAGDSEFECTIAQLAANAITDLLDRAEAAERKAKDLEQALSDASKIVKTMQDSTIPFYRRRAEEAEASNSQLDGTVKTLMESNKKLADTLREAESRAEKAEKCISEIEDAIRFGRYSAAMLQISELRGQKEE